VKPIHELVSTVNGETVAAVDFDGRSVSYAELDGLASILVGYLSRHGIRTGDRAILMIQDVSRW